MQTPYDTTLPPHLRALKEEIEGYAREYGLDFFETIFEVIEAEDLNEVAAYGGFPTRYPHWSFGMAFEELKKSYDYGLSKIYEMVINNDPCYAYLMRSNHDVDQKLVMAHVYGHCDFFKNNAYFAHTSRKMMDEMANHGARIRSYAEKYGEDEVEAFMDRCMSIDDLIDIHSTAIRRRKDVSRYDFTPEEEGAAEQELRPTRFKSKDYMDDYINPRDILAAEEAERRKAQEQLARSFPEAPEKDILLFLIEHAPLKPWQRDILSIVRDEAYYFMPQAQTKIINEGWACLVGDSLVSTDCGLLRLRDLVTRRQPVKVHDGEGLRRVYDWAAFRDRETVCIRTALGFEVEGSCTHQVMLPDGSWRRLDEVKVGDRVRIAAGADLWASQPVRLSWQPLPQRAAVALVGGTAGVEEKVDSSAGIPGPLTVDERLARLLACLVAQGSVDARLGTFTFTTSDEKSVERFADLAEEVLGVRPILEEVGQGWRALCHSAQGAEFLTTLGADGQDVPEAILRSPRPVVLAFLAELFACAGQAVPGGITLHTRAEALGKTLQLLLLNLGILCSRRAQADGGWRIHLAENEAARFLQAISSATMVSEGTEGREDHPDEVVFVERRHADVFDVSVEGTHRYAAQGLVNHNSYWHSTIMTQKALAPSEVIDYADHHSGTMAMSRTRINPYKLGIELLRDIEMRWNTGRFGKEYDECEDLERKRTWDLGLGLGRKKIFEVRRVHNDITFIDTFLTPEFCVQHGFFSFAWQEQSGQYVIESRDFEKIKQRLLFSLTNFGKPWIVVVDGNYRNRGELLLKHQFSGVELRLDQAADTLANIQFIWGRPVHLQTLVDGKPTTLSFDGTDHSIKTGGDSDDARRTPPAKPR